jgi:hypothetical protein
LIIFKKRKLKEKRNKEKMQASEYLSEKSSSFLDRDEMLKNDKEIPPLFQAYLLKKKYEILDELSTFHEGSLDDESNTFSIDHFISDEDFKKYVQEMNLIKKRRNDENTIDRIFEKDNLDEKEIFANYEELFEKSFKAMRRTISEKLLIKNTSERKKIKKIGKKEINFGMSVEMEEKKILKKGHNLDQFKTKKAFLVESVEEQALKEKVHDLDQEQVIRNFDFSFSNELNIKESEINFNEEEKIVTEKQLSHIED